MNTAEASTRLRFLHNEWWNALINKRPAAAEYWAEQIVELAKELLNATKERT